MLVSDSGSVLPGLTWLGYRRSHTIRVDPKNWGPDRRLRLFSQCHTTGPSVALVVQRPMLHIEVNLRINRLGWEPGERWGRVRPGSQRGTIVPRRLLQPARYNSKAVADMAEAMSTATSKRR